MKARRLRVGEGKRPRLETRLANRGGNDASHRKHEEDSEDSKNGANAALHFESRDSNSRYRHRNGLIAHNACDTKTDLP